MANTQIIPDNASSQDNPNRRNVVDQTIAPTNLSIKNPIPIQVKMRSMDGRQFGLNLANQLVAKFKQQLSIAPQDLPTTGGGIQQLTQYIKKLDPNNTSGAVQPALNIMDKLLKDGTSNMTGSIPGVLGNLMQQLQQALNTINQNNAKQNQQQPPPQCPNGQIWCANAGTCVIANTTTSSDFLTS